MDAPLAATFRQRSRHRWRTLAAIELALAVSAVLWDPLVPSIAILGVAAIGLAIRHQGLASVGMRRLPQATRAAGQILGLTAGWSLIQLGLLMPVLNHVTGDRQDLTDFGSLQGDVRGLVYLLVLSWTLAAVVEEIVFRGYLPARIIEAFGAGRLTTAAAIAVPAILFSLIHTEQGLVGVVVTFFDALFFTALRVRNRSVWASVLAHGFNNTLGVITFFLIGPVYGLW